MARTTIFVLPLSLFVLFCSFTLSSSFLFLSGSPNEYSVGDKIPLKISKLTSSRTFIPFSYYSLPFCRPAELESSARTLGEVLLGDQIQNSAFQMKVGEDLGCQLLCRIQYRKDQLEEFEERIRQEYKAQWLVDNLPAVNISGLIKVEDKDYVGDIVGVDLGYLFESQVYLHNHFDITLLYNKLENSKVTIVGFFVSPLSVRYPAEESPSNDPGAAPENCFERLTLQPLQISGPILRNETDQILVQWTYTLKWKESVITWNDRWFAYLQRGDSKIHWFSVINSLLIAVFMTAMVAMILIKTLRNDLKKYSESQNFVIDEEQSNADAHEMAKEEVDETGWKQIHGDVFRAPTHYGTLSILVGSGVQTFVCGFITLAFAAVGFLSPAFRGALLTALTVVYPVMGIFAGYTSGRLYKMFGGTSIKTNWLLTIFVVPGVIFSLFFVSNWVLWSVKSSAGVGAGPFFGVLFLWFGVSFVMSSIGSWVAHKLQPIEHPVKINPIPRQIPIQSWYANPWLMIFIGGILPFGVIFVESYFLFSSLWLQQFYYLFGFLMIIFLIFFITCAETSIVMCYLQLSREDYHWWWRAFLTTSSSTLYLFLYAFFYFFLRLSINSFPAGVLYFLYTLIICVVFFVLTGSLGFYSCFYFVRKIYGSIKID